MPIRGKHSRTIGRAGARLIARLARSRALRNGSAGSRSLTLDEFPRELRELRVDLDQLSTPNQRMGYWQSDPPEYAQED
jgi:hypothetical protein